MEADGLAGFVEQVRQSEGIARLLPDLVRSDALVDGIRPLYERIYRRCLTQPIPADTHPARW